MLTHWASSTQLIVVVGAAVEVVTVVVDVVVVVVVVVKTLAQLLHKTGQRLTTNVEVQSAGAALAHVASSVH